MAGQFAAGAALGQYRILSLLGKGGMGEVYLAEDTRLGRKIALKLLSEEFTRDAERVRRFEREARAASALNHPNILTIHDIGKSDEAHFIATEFIDGPTLRQRMHGGPLTLRETLDIATQSAGALAAAHAGGIVHRDVKPENIMLRRDGYVKARKLLDDLKQRAKQRHVSSQFMAQIHLGLGEKDLALQSLEKAFAERSTIMQWLKMEPMFDPLRKEPRFQDLVRKVGLP